MVQVREEFEYVIEDPQVYGQVEGIIAINMLHIPKMFKVLGMRMTRFVVVSHDLVVLSEETLYQPPPIPLIFRNVEEEFSRELQSEMEKPFVVYLSPMLGSIVDLGVEIREFRGWNFEAELGVKVGEMVVNMIVEKASVCEKDISVMEGFFHLREVVSLELIVWKTWL